MIDRNSNKLFYLNFISKIGVLYEKYVHITLLLIVVTAILLIFINKARIPFFLAISSREAQTASQTRYFYNSGIDLLHPKYDLTPTPQYLLLEFPIYQALVAVIYHIAGFNESWGKILSVLALIGSLIYMFLISNHFLKNKYVSVVSTMLFAVAPYTIRFFPIFMIDPTALFLSLVTLYHGIIWIEKNNKVNFAIFFVAGLLAMLIKFIFLIPICVPLFVLFVVSLKKPLRNERKRIAQFSIAIFCWGIALIGWVIWSDYLNGQTTLQAFNDSIVQGNVIYTNIIYKFFGTLAMRTDPNYLSSLNWIMGAFIPTWISPWLFYGLLILGIILNFTKSRKSINIFVVSWVIGFVFVLAVFFPALSTHIYYWLVAVPIAALVLASLIDVIFSFLKDLAINIRLNSKYTQILLFFLVLIAGEIGITFGLQTFMKGFHLFDYRIPNQFDYFTGLILFFFIGLLWLWLVYYLFYKQLPIKMMLSVIFIGLISVTFYSNLFHPSERYWDIPPDRGYHWSTMRLLLREAEYIDSSNDSGKPVAIVTKYNYYPHILYLSTSQGYTLRYPEKDVNQECISASGFPFMLSNPCVLLMHQQGIEEVYVVFYDKDLDMKEEEFKNLAPLLHLKLVDEMMSDESQYGNVLLYHIDLP